jgi:AraC family transcriptional regulator
LKVSTKHLSRLSAVQTRRVKDYINANLACELKLRDLADLVALSPRQFQRKFVNTFGVTLHKCVMQERVERAKQFIAAGQLLVEIADCLGFASQSHFSSVFRKIAGTSPGRFRRERT